jgi:hypothetical protein
MEVELKNVLKNHINVSAFKSKKDFLTNKLKIKKVFKSIKMLQIFF